MLPRGSPLILAIAATLLVVHACIWLGGAMGTVAIVLCAFLLMIGSPIAILAWLGSLSDLDAQQREKLHRARVEKARAELWQRTLLELQPSAPHYSAPTLVTSGNPATEPRALSIVGRVATASAALAREGRRIKRSILALCLSVAAAAGLSGCGVPPEAWAAVHPGISTAQLVAVVGGPDYVRSNGVGEVWQYCRDFPGRDEGRYARYYTAVYVNNQEVKEIRPYPALSDAGCEEYYRSNFPLVPLLPPPS